jgi:WD40 repeat protein
MSGSLLVISVLIVESTFLGAMAENPHPRPPSRKAARGETENKSATGPITALVWNEKEILIGSQGGLEVRSWPELKTLRKLPTELSSVHDIAFSSDATKLFVVGGRPGQSGAIEIYHWPKGDVALRATPNKDVIYAVAWNEASDRVVTASADGKLAVIDASNGKVIKSIEGHSRPTTCVAWLPNNTIISGSTDESLRIWNAQSGESIRTLSNHTKPVLGLAFRPQQKEQPMVASIGADKTVRFWQPAIGRMVRFVKLVSEPRALAWSQDGKLLVVACVDGKVCVINPETAEIQSKLNGISGVAHCVTMTKDGQVIVAGEGGQIRTMKLP